MTADVALVMACIFVLVVGALVCRWPTLRPWGRYVVVGASGFAFAGFAFVGVAMAAAVLRQASEGPWVPSHGMAVASVVRFAADESRAGAMAVICALTTVVGLTMGRRHVEQGQGSALLALAAADCALVCSDNVLTLLVVSCIGVLPVLWPWSQRGTRREVRTGQRLLGIYLGSSLMVVGLVAAAVALWNPGGELEIFLRSFGAAAELGRRSQGQASVFLVLGLLALVRQGIFPFHSWVPAGLGGAAEPALVLFVGAHALTMAVLPLVAPMVAGLASPWATLVLGLGAVTNLYGAVLAFGQSCLRRTVACVVVSQGGFLAASLVAHPLEGTGPALFQLLSHALASTGLLVVTSLVAARVGTTDMRAMGGLSRKAPGLGWSFLLLSLASVGLPGSTGFVADDLPLHLLAEYHPGFALLFLFGTALGGAALFRAHAKVFWGKPGPTLSVHGAFSLRLLPREAVGVGLLVAAIFGIGCAPQGILSLFPGHSQESSVEATRPIFSSLR